MGMFFWVKKVVSALIVSADGTGDYTDIQTALDALPASGGEVFVKAGTYVLTATITFPNAHISLMGAGSSALLNVDAVSGTVLDTSGHDNISISGLRIVSDDVTNANIGIHMNGSSSCIVRAVWLETMETSIKVTSGSYNLIEADISGGHENAFSVIWLASADFNIISGVNCNVGTENAINLDDSDSNTIKGNIIVGAYDGINLDADSAGNIITHNNFLSITNLPINDSGSNNQIGHNITS